MRLLVLALVASHRLQHSRIGWAWQAIREDELAARAMGINTTVAKLQAFAIGASFAGFAGNSRRHSQPLSRPSCRNTANASTPTTSTLERRPWRRPTYPGWRRAGRTFAS